MVECLSFVFVMTDTVFLFVLFYLLSGRLTHMLLHGSLFMAHVCSSRFHYSPSLVLCVDFFFLQRVLSKRDSIVSFEMDGDGTAGVRQSLDPIVSAMDTYRRAVREVYIAAMRLNHRYSTISWSFCLQLSH